MYLQADRPGNPAAVAALYQELCAVTNHVVARFLDGRVMKGQTLDMDPARPTFHLRNPLHPPLEIKLAELKALFFVKDLRGDPARVDGAELEPDDARARGAQPIEVEFADGERVVGLTVRYPPVRPYFYVLPADEGSNNVRILVNKAAVVRTSRPSAAA
jgi:hypothetical protein